MLKKYVKPEPRTLFKTLLNVETNSEKSGNIFETKALGIAKIKFTTAVIILKKTEKIALAKINHLHV